MKDIHVILAFHAHEPLWELPKTLLDSVEDIDLKQTFASENWIVRRSAEGRDARRGPACHTQSALLCPAVILA